MRRPGPGRALPCSGLLPSIMLPAIRLGALRRGLLVEIFSGEYGMYRQEMMDVNSALYRFAPDAILLCLDATHVAGAETADEDYAFENMGLCWPTLNTVSSAW